MHSLSQLARTLSLLALSLICKIKYPAPGSDATVSHFGCSTGHKQRVVSERTHTASLSLSHSTAAILPLSLTLSLTRPLWSLLSRPHGRKTSFLITPRTTSFSSVTSSSARGLLSALISTFLSAALFPLSTRGAVVVFIPLRVIQAYYGARLLFAARRQIFAWNMRRGRTSQWMSGWWGWEGAAAGSVRRLNVWQAPDLYFPIVERQL